MVYGHIPQKSYQVRGAMDISFQFKVSFDVEQGRPGTGEIWHCLSKPPQQGCENTGNPRELVP